MVYQKTKQEKNTSNTEWKSHFEEILKDDNMMAVEEKEENLKSTTEKEKSNILTEDKLIEVTVQLNVNKAGREITVNKLVKPESKIIFKLPTNIWKGKKITSEWEIEMIVSKKR